MDNICPPSMIFSSALDTQRLDKLNHFCFAFESGREIDTEYFQKFTDFIKSLNIESHELAETLIKAGEKEDAQTIRKTLPVFYKELKNQLAANNEQITEADKVQELLEQIKQALVIGDTATAGKALKALGTGKFSPEDRELYFTLYDLLLEDKAEQALETITKLETRNDK